MAHAAIPTADRTAPTAGRDPAIAYDVAAKLGRPLYLEINRRGDAPRNVGFTNPADDLADALDRCEEPERWDGMA